jgi:hypothetical protein
MPQFDVTKITNYLDKYKNQLDELYDWKPIVQGLAEIGVANETKLSELQSSAISNFQKDEKLKSLLSKALNSYAIDSQEFERIALWIIHDWGRINTGLDTMKHVLEFLRTDRPKFKRIASTSKVGGFMTPTKRIIYDSRVAYTVNWIILSENAGDKFFPIPEGRNSKMQAFNLDVLIRLKFINNYRPDKTEDLKKGKFIFNKDKEIYIPKADAYYELNKLVGKVNQILWNDFRKQEPFYTEMLLFALADKGVFQEITERVRIEIG